jgi:hypothetical protein
MPAEELNAGDQLFVCLTPQSGGLSPEKCARSDRILAGL